MENADSGYGKDAPKNGNAVDSLKRSRGLLSFRSRKLLLNSLSSRKSGATNANAADKRGAALPPRESIVTGRAALPSQQSVSCKEEPTKAARRELWGPRKIERESAIAANSNARRTKKRLPGQKKKDGKEGKEHSDGEPPPQLSPRVKLLETFYEGLEAATSLLRIRRQMCTLKAVCKIVESMSKRRFLPKHLAQIKHIFPEVLQLEYVRCQDRETWGEKWDLRITLLPLSSDCAVTTSPLKGSAGQTAQTMRRRKEFHARLLRFASSNPGEGDVPQELLPVRPSGGNLPQVSTVRQPEHVSRCLNLDSSLSRNAGDAEVAALGSTTEVGAKEEDLSFKGFSIVKPSRDDNDTSDDPRGTSHFPASFRPFFSVRSTGDAHRRFSETSQRLDEAQQPLEPHSEQGVAEVKAASDVSSATRDDSDSVLLGGTSHFPASFRPFFSVRHTVDAATSSIQASPISGIARPDEPQDQEAEAEIPTVLSSAPSGAAPANPCNLHETTGHFPPSFIPVFSVNSKDLATPSTSQPSSSSLRHACYSPVSPVPVHTPPFLSPMNNFRTAQESPIEGSRKTPATNSVQLKSHGTMRSLKFGSPASSSRLSNAVDFDSIGRSPDTASVKLSPKDKNEVRCNSVASPIPPSTPAYALPEGPRNLIQASPVTPPCATANAPQYVSSFLSPVKNSKSRSLRFDTPAKACVDELTPAQASFRDLVQHLTPPPPKAAAAEPSQCVFPRKSLPSNSPQTPALSIPVRAPRGKETLNSPPKRARLNRLTLFSDDDEVKEHDSVVPSVIRIVGETKRISDAIGESVIVERSAAVDSQQEASAPSKLQQCSATEDMKGISESDLAILQCLPPDLVQSVREKEKRLKAESTMELAKLKRRQQMISGVPKLLNQLRLIFQSLNRSILPRNELIKSILASHPDITDRGEVEERLQLIVELAPDYMTTRPSHGGGLLYRVDKRADVVGIQKRLCAGV